MDLPPGAVHLDSELHKKPAIEGAQQSAASTCTVEILSEPGPAQQSAASAKKPLSDSPRMLIGIVKQAVADAGELAVSDINVPPKARE